MRAVVWISEHTWEACVEQARMLLTPEVEVTLLHVSSGDAEELADAGREGLLGRRAPAPAPALRAISDQQAGEILAAAKAHLGRPVGPAGAPGQIDPAHTRAERCRKA